MIEFSVTGWSAWAPGLPLPEDWLRWAQAPTAPAGEGAPALADVPPVMRRRIDRLGRMAIAATDDLDRSPEREAVPLVFVSRHGDVAGSVELLRALGQSEPLSPTAFSLSVHNAVAALYSIVRKRQGNYLAVAAGRGSVEAACVEAAGLLADGAPEVLVVCYDGPLPEVYADFADEPAHHHAWCWRLAAAAAPGTRLSLSWSPARAADTAEAADAAPALQHGLEMQRFLLAGEPSLDFVEHGQHWRWLRHG